MNYAKLSFDILDANENLINKETAYVSTLNNNPKQIFEDYVYFLYSDLNAIDRIVANVISFPISEDEFSKEKKGRVARL